MFYNTQTVLNVPISPSPRSERLVALRSEPALADIDIWPAQLRCPSLWHPGRSAIPTPSSDSAASKALKRRSLLPQLSRQILPDEAEECIRRSNGQSTVSVHATLEEEDHGEAAVPAAAQNRLKRPVSMRPPARSTSRASLRPETREPDHSSNGTTSSAATAAPSRTSTEFASTRRAGETSQSTATIQRTASTRKTHVRTGSTLASARSNGRAQAPTPTSPVKAVDRPAVKLDAHGRAAFNTYQQHFSPAKMVVPKPPVPTSKVETPAPVGDVPLDVAKQQIELFQLSLMHEKACAEVVERERAAQSMLRETHQRLRKILGQIIGQELERERQTNLVAMSLWQSDQSYLMDRLRVLQKIHHEVIAMVQDGSSFVSTVLTFRVWAANAESLIKGERLGFVTGLTEDWRHAHASAALRVRSLQRELVTLPPASRPSSVFTLMTSCEALLDGMLRELDLMSQIERELLRQDRVRIDDAVDALPTIAGNTPTDWVPLWQQVS